MNVKKQLLTCFESTIQHHRKYCFTVKNHLHIMDSQFIMSEIIHSSDEEMQIIYDVIEEMDPLSEDNLHQFLEHLATIYVIGRS